jgi:hypothetical protein
MMAVSYSVSIFGSIMDNDFIIKELEKKCLKLQQERDDAIKQRDKFEIQLCQYILKAENEKAAAARLPHSRGLHPRVAALKGTHNKE